MDENSNTVQDGEQSSKARQVDPLPLKSTPPKPSAGLNKRTIIVAVSLGAFLLFVALIDGLSSSDRSGQQAYKDERRASLGESVRNLPNTYADIVRKPEIKTPQEQAQEAKRPNKSSLEQYLEELRIARLKEASLAHKADVTFSGLTIPKKSKNHAKNVTTLNLPQLNNQFNGKSTSASNPRDDFNRQDDKYSFLNDPNIEESILNQPLLPPLSPYEVKAGSVIPGMLLTGINSDLPGKLLAHVSQNVFDSVSGNNLLIPQGTKVVGEYDSRIVYGQERVLIVWSRLVLPNGKSIVLEGMPGVDLSGYSGLSERVNNHYLRLLSGVVLGSVIGASAQMAQGPNRTINPSFEQLALEGAAQNINRAGQQITERNLNLQPTIEVSPGHRFNIFVTRDIILEPYET